MLRPRFTSGRADWLAAISDATPRHRQSPPMPACRLAPDGGSGPIREALVSRRRRRRLLRRQLASGDFALSAADFASRYHAPPLAEAIPACLALAIRRQAARCWRALGRFDAAYQYVSRAADGRPASPPASRGLADTPDFSPQVFGAPHEMIYLLAGLMASSRLLP